MPHFYKRLVAMVLMCALSLGAVRGLPILFPASSFGEVHYTPITASDRGTVMTIGGHPVTTETYALCFIDYAAATNNMLSSLGMSWSSVWSEEEFLANIRTYSDLELAKEFAIVELMNHYNLHLTRAQIDEALAMKQETIDYTGGPEAFQEQLDAIGMTEEMFNNRIYIAYAQERLNAYLFGEGGEFYVSTDEARTYLTEHFIRAKHVLISDSTENAEELAQEIAQRAKGGENFDALVIEYGEDPGMQTSPDGYVFTEGDMVDEFYEGASALTEGEVSEPIRSSFGWHIIQRLPVEEVADEYIAENRDLLIYSMGAYSMDDLLDEKANAMEIVHNDELYQAINLSNVSDYLVPAETGDAPTDDTEPAPETPEADATEPTA